MAQVKHHIFTLASVVSLLLLAATAVFWIRSYSRSEEVGRDSIRADGRRGQRVVHSWHGKAYLHHWSWFYPSPSAPKVLWRAISKPGAQADFATSLSVRAVTPGDVQHPDQWQ